MSGNVAAFHDCRTCVRLALVPWALRRLQSRWCSADTGFAPPVVHSAEHHWTENWCFSTTNMLQFAFINTQRCDGLRVSLGKRAGLRFTLWIKSTAWPQIVLWFSFLHPSFLYPDLCFPFPTHNYSCLTWILPVNEAAAVLRPVLKRRGGQNKWASEQQLGSAGCYYMELFVCTNEHLAGVDGNLFRVATQTSDRFVPHCMSNRTSV